jgi:F0F1-type ATP synthase membrane subunit c/vacuolar-type H+-ATPase subunit K
MFIIAALCEVIALVGSLVALLILFGAIPETYL